MDEQEKVTPKKNRWLATFWAFLVVYGALYFLAFIDFSFLNSEIVNYSIECSEKPINNNCNGEILFAMRAQHYKPNVDRQEVLYWTEGFSPERLTNCAVVDRKNWKCSWDDNSATFGFNKGMYFNISDREDRLDHDIKTNRYTWLKQTCSQSIYNYFVCVPLYSYLYRNT